MRKCDCRFLAGAQNASQFPRFDRHVPEYAFVGRSNVGKSTLINSLTGIKNLARVSKTPGRTQQINFFSVDDKFILVDLPGYGYATVSKQMRKSWDSVIYDYLCERSQLRCVFMLIDARRGVMQSDISVLQLLNNHAIPCQIVLTKCDTVNNVDEVMKAVEKEISSVGCLVYQIMSSISIKDIAQLR